MPAHAQEVIELTGEDRWLEADFQELYRIGTLTGEDWEQFGDVHDVAFDGAGRLHIIDTQSERVFVVGTDGRLIRELGGQGDGPGEFGDAIAMAVTADGRVVVADMSRYGYHVFGPDGEFRRTVRMAGNPSITTVGILQGTARRRTRSFEFRRWRDKCCSGLARSAVPSCYLRRTRYCKRV